MAQVMIYKAPNKETRDLSEMAIKGQATQINQLATLLQQNHGQAVEPDPAFVLPQYLSQALRDSSLETAEAQLSVDASGAPPGRYRDVQDAS